MSYHYIKQYYGDNTYFPDSSWKRMQRYNASHGDTLIFNFGNGGYGGGFYSTGCCNGGSFWSGFGAGLGHGLANLAFGLIGGLFGGFMGGGMFGMTMFNNYGMVPDYTGFGGFGGYSNFQPIFEVKKEEPKKETKEEKSDVEKLIEKVNKIDNKSKIDDIDKLIKEIVEKLKDEDNITITNKKDLENAKESLERIKKEIENKE